MIQNTGSHQRNRDNNFAENWYDKKNMLLQLLLSEQIWKRYGFKTNQKPEVQSEQHQPKEGVYQTVFYLDDEPILMASHSNGKSDEHPPHDIIFTQP